MVVQPDTNRLWCLFFTLFPCSYTVTLLHFNKVACSKQDTVRPEERIYFLDLISKADQLPEDRHKGVHLIVAYHVILYSGNQL